MRLRERLVKLGTRKKRAIIALSAGVKTPRRGTSLQGEGEENRSYWTSGVWGGKRAKLGAFVQ